MPRIARFDRPGAWHHVYIRGIARRTVVERLRDVRVLKYLLAREVRRGTIEVHALCALTTHVHLLLLSCRGELSRALKRILNAYVRWFNRSRRRDGSLFRGRFGSRPVTTISDRLNVIAYLDANPVQARMAQAPEAYPHASATYWHQGRAPRWFATWFVAEMLGVAGPGSKGAWEAYCALFRPRGTVANARLMDARMKRRDAPPDPLDDLVGAAPPRVAAWMHRKAQLADQTRPGLPVLDLATVDAVWKAGRDRIQGTVRGRRGPGRALDLIARVALLRDLAGLRYQSIAERIASTASECRTRYRLHAQRLDADPEYAAALAALAHEALRAVHQVPSPAHLSDVSRAASRRVGGGGAPTSEK